MSELFVTGMSIVGYAQVALEQGIDMTATGLTYAIPEALKSRASDR